MAAQHQVSTPWTSSCATEARFGCVPPKRPIGSSSFGSSASFPPQLVSAIPWSAHGRRSPRRTGPRIGLDRARGTPSVSDGGWRRSNRRSGQLRSASRSCERRGRLHRRRRLPGTGHRDALARAACRACRSSWDRAFRRRGDGRQRADDRRLRGRRLRGLENLRRRRGGDDISHRVNTRLRLTCRGT